MTRVALLTISDRPDLLADTIASLAEALDRDEGDVLSAFATHAHVDDREHRLGFGGAIRYGWERLRGRADFDYVLHVEDDWRFDAPVELGAMADLLDARPELAQVALRRNPVNDVERKAGGVVEMWPDEYADRAMTIVEPDCSGRELAWLDHELYFTTNPSLYRRSLLDLEWPDCPASEQVFTAKCLRAGLRFALYGTRAEAPRVTHLGDNRREGRGY